MVTAAVLQQAAVIHADSLRFHELVYIAHISSGTTTATSATYSRACEPMQSITAQSAAVVIFKCVRAGMPQHANAPYRHRNIHMVVCTIHTTYYL
eukprot:9165-Heterococcus_DN1.PRE.1